MKGWLDTWPVKGTDLNPLDYGLWSVLQDRVWVGNCKNDMELRCSVLKHISEMPQEEIRKCILSFPKRIDACIKGQGDHFEYKL